MILPAVIKQIYLQQSEVLADILEPIVPGLKGTPDEAQQAAVGVEKWLFGLGITSKLEDEGFTQNDIPKLVDLTFNTPSLDLLLSMAPIKAERQVVETIFKESMKPY